LLECSESDVDEAVQSAADLLGARGVRVFDLSIPMHRDAVAVWAAILFEGASDQLMAGDGVGTNWRGRYARRSSWQRSAHDAAQTGMTYHRL
jgi:amidase